MLPPVNAVANSSIAFQDPRTAPDGASEGRSTPAGQPLQAANGLERNAAIAGRLNLLMLSGQERMSDNLTLLVNLLGSRLGMERGEGESLSAFAGRLVQALADASPQIRQSVQRQLAQMFGGLQLRTLIEAFRNPAGPEAATLTIYLELYRAKDRDLAARSVVTSYRQNGGEARPSAAPVSSPAAGGHLAAGAPSQPSANPVRAEAASGRPLASSSESELPDDGAGLDDPMAPVAKGRLFSMQDEQSRKILKLAAARALQTVMFQGAQKGVDQTPSAATQTPASAEAGEAGGPVPSSARAADVDDMRTASLRKNDEPAAAARTGKARIDTAGAGDRSASDAKGAVNASEGRGLEGQPKARAADGDRTQTLFVLKGWQEDGPQDAASASQASLPAPEEILPDPARLLAPAGIEEMPAAAAAEAQAAATGEPATAADDARPSEPETEALEHLAEPEGDPSAADRMVPGTAEMVQAMPDLELALARPPFAAREGIPLPLVNYLFATDDPDGENGVKHRFSRDDGDGGAQSDQGFGDEAGEEAPHGEQGAEDEEAAEQQATAEARRPGADAAETEGETANDLYWRMAGWS
ncbi:MAG: hypothetical protein ACK4PN_05565 [Allorhizobium sp.]